MITLNTVLVKTNKTFRHRSLQFFAKLNQKRQKDKKDFAVFFFIVKLLSHLKQKQFSRRFLSSLSPFVSHTFDL